MTFTLGIGLIIAIVAAIALALLLVAARTELGRYQSIQDVEQFRKTAEQAAQAAQADHARLTALAEANKTQILSQQHKIKEYFKVLGKLKSVAELDARIESTKAKIQQLNTTLGPFQRAAQLSEYIQRQEASIAQNDAEFQSLQRVIGAAKTVSEIAARATYYENYVAQLKSDIEAVEEAGAMQEFGFYRARYDFDTSDKYRQRLESVRNKQKMMLKSKTACVCSVEWTVDGDKKKGRKMVDQQVSLMLRAFNGECDAAISKVRYNNVVALQTRIDRSFAAINKQGLTQSTTLQEAYRNLKLEELFLCHEYQEKKQEEKEVQQQIREQMKEEEKVAAEIAKAQADSAREAALKTKALERARAELAQTTGAQTVKLEQLVAKLETELSAAIDRKAKAIARAQLTKSGHVYILSNLGAFGENVFKIGLTRRLEPLERVKELGSASVPFPFDVHAMIYAEDAPALENALHKHFASRRVNMVNLRREFFRVSLDEIRAAVAEQYGHISFLLVAEAEQFRRTQALQKESHAQASHLQIA